MADTLDPTMNTLIHHAVLREIDRMSAAVQRLIDDGSQPSAGLIRRWQFLSDQLRHHHEGEDKFLWPIARERSQQPQEVAVLDAMEAEHHALQNQLDVIDKAMTDAAAGQAIDARQLQTDLAALRKVTAGHCQHEERDGMKVLQRYVKSDDLADFHKYTRSGPDTSLVFPWICDGATPQEQASAWGVLPGFVRLFAKPIMNRKYSAFLTEVAQ